MKKTLLLILIIVCSHDIHAQENLCNTMWKQSAHVIRATAIERGRCIRMEDGVTFCSFRFAVSEIYKGTIKTGDSIWVELTLYGNIGLGGKFYETDSFPYCSTGTEYILFLHRDMNPFDMQVVRYKLMDDVLGLQPATEQMLWYLKSAIKE